MSSQIISGGFSYFEPSSSFPKAFPGPSTLFVGLSELVFATSSSSFVAPPGPSSPFSSFLAPSPIPIVSFTLSLVPITFSLIFSPVEPSVMGLHIANKIYQYSPNKEANEDSLALNTKNCKQDAGVHKKCRFIAPENVELKVLLLLLQPLQTD